MRLGHGISKYEKYHQDSEICWLLADYVTVCFGVRPCKNAIPAGKKAIIDVKIKCRLYGIFEASELINPFTWRPTSSKIQSRLEGTIWGHFSVFTQPDSKGAGGNNYKWRITHYELFAQNEDSTRLNFNVNWLGANLPEESKQGMMQAQAINLGNLKELCEKVVWYEMYFIS